MKGFISVSLFGAVSLITMPALATDLSIYGQGHLSFDSVDDGYSSSLYTSSNSSRFGIKGSHDLGKDLSVIFQYETGVDLTAQGFNDGNGPGQSSGQLFTKGRPSFIGLKGEFGTLLIGHMPYLDQWANDYNLFADQVGDLGNLWEASGIPGRSDNVVYFKSKNHSGFELSGTYVPEESDDNTQSTLVKGAYKANGLQVNVAYSTLGQGATSPDNHQSLAFTTAYDFGDFTLGGGYQSETDIAGVIGQDRKSLYIGGSVNIGTHGQLKAQYASSQSDSVNADATQFALGYDYSYNNQTILYVAYAAMDNDTEVNFSVNGKGHGDKVVPMLGNDPSVISLGIVYRFDHQLMK